MKDAIVIGVRPDNFGRFHAINLARKNVGRLVLTSTTEEGARRNSEFFGMMAGPGAREIVGAKVSNRNEFERLLEGHDVGLVIISAKEHGRYGNSVHVGYAISGLNHPSRPFIVCEKPLSDGNDRRRGVKSVGELAEAYKRFDIHLPVYLIFQEASKQSEELGNAILHADKVEICWAVKKESPAFIIDNLGPHAWSVVGRTHDVKAEAVRLSTDKRDSVVYATLSEHGAPVQAEIGLSYGFSFRGARFGDFAVEVATEGASNVIYELRTYGSESFLDLVRGGHYKRKGRIASVDNPMGSFIDSAIQGVPVVGAANAIKSQEFLQGVYELAGK
jgi:hypothetical protein